MSTYIGSKMAKAPEQKSVPIWAVIAAIVGLAGFIGFLVMKAATPAPPTAQVAPLPDDMRAHYQNMMGATHHTGAPDQPAAK